jgi:hypothetical protein
MAITTAIFPHDTVPSVFLYQDSQGMIRTVCCIHSTQALHGHPAGPWDGKVLAFASEVVHGQVTTVILLVRELFSITDPTTVPTVHAIHANLAATANTNLLGPYTVGDADTEFVQSRRYVLVPYQYVPLLLHRSLNPIEAWNQVGMQVLQDGKEQDCYIFLNFLRMTAVSGAVNAAGVATPPTVSMPVSVYPPLADESLLCHIHCCLHEFLPGLAMSTGNTILGYQILQGTAMIQDTMQHQMATLLADRQAASKEARAPKTFTKAYPAMAPALHKLCGVTTDANLPKFWKILAVAGGKKNQGFPALQQLMMARVNDDDSAQVRHILPAMLHKYISQFQLGSSDPENISHGLSPFLMCPMVNRTFHGLPRLPERYFVSTQPVLAALPHGEAPPCTQVQTGGAHVVSPPEHVRPEWLAAFESSNWTIPAMKLLPSARLPMIGNWSGPLCLSYHLKGPCFDNCRNKGTHWALSSSEEAAMKLFVENEL